MKGGVGRYAYHLASALKQKKNMDIFIAMSKLKNKPNSSTDTDTNSSNEIYYNIVNKGDEGNSDRLLNLVNQLKPDIVNVQYERGLYEDDTSIRRMFSTLMHRSTLDKFFKLCPVPTVSTLHTVLPYDEYQEYIKDIPLRKNGRLAALPAPIRSSIRKFVLQRRYRLLLEIVKKSKEIVTLAKSNKTVAKRGSIIYHGAESFRSTSSQNKSEYRSEFGLPKDKKLLLAFGYVGSYKGFDILNNLKLPNDWSLVVKQNNHERGKENPVGIKDAINLHLDYLDDAALSRLFFACDAIIFPYRVVSISGVLFDALAHGLPFIASDLRFFREFAEMGLGITCKRDPESFSESLLKIASNYERYRLNVEKFRPELKWENIADRYISCYRKLL
jgi:glycosyltransferase involved in cell wall biosynthesis